MNTERMKILEMLKEGKISAEDADRLLDKLAQLDREPEDDDVVIDEDSIHGAVASAVATAKEAAQAVKLKVKAKASGRKFFCIKINTANGKNINLRLPLAVAKAGVKLSALLPQSATDSLKEKGINLDELTQLKGDELTGAIEELDINIDTDEGDSIRIFCE